MTSDDQKIINEELNKIVDDLLKFTEYPNFGEIQYSKDFKINYSVTPYKNITFGFRDYRINIDHYNFKYYIYDYENKRPRVINCKYKNEPIYYRFDLSVGSYSYDVPEKSIATNFTYYNRVVTEWTHVKSYNKNGIDVDLVRNSLLNELPKYFHKINKQIEKNSKHLEWISRQKKINI